ncbi:MAG: replicative DNA helicase [Phycisphaerales bacterium]|nr:replicative DNA helicase [Phycisphaerales bacterium]
MTTATTNRPPATVRAERVPPQDLDAEMALLGSMMMSRDAIAEVIPVIGRADAPWFYLPVHQKLFEVLLDLYDDPAKAIDLIVVTDELRRRDLHDFVGGQEYMIQLAESFSDWANAEHYARIVRDKGMLRDLIRCASEISNHAYTGMDEARDILDVAERKIFECTEKRVSGQSIAIRDLVRRLTEQLELRHEGICTGVPTGFTQLNEYTGGFQPGDFIVLAGRPSMGKTALGLTMAQHAALEQRIPVAFFSMEMSGAQVAQRLVCSHGHGIDLQRLRRRTLTDEEMHELLHACADFEQAPFYIDDTAGMTIMELRAKARRLKQRFDIQVVFVDYLQLMHTPQAENRQVEISTISRGMKALARELNIPVIAMAQLNRMPEGRSDKRPLMSDLRESGAIEQDADVVLLIHREEYYKPEDESAKGLAELIIAKQRNGPTGNITLSFHRKYTRFGNYSAEPEPYRAAPSARSDVPF